VDVVVSKSLGKIEVISDIFSRLRDVNREEDPVIET